MDETVQDVNVYDETQARITAAYSAFEGVYRMQRPEPVRPAAARLSMGDGLIIISIAIMVFAAMIVSGSRTIEEFGQVGGAAFLMLEVGALILAIWRAIHANEDQRRLSHRLVKVGLIICIGVMLSANIDSTARAHNVSLPEALQTAILFAVAISAPVLTLIAGDLLGIQVVAIGRRQVQLDSAHDAATKDWRDGMLRSWEAQKSRWGATVQIDRPMLDAGQEIANAPRLSSVQLDTGQDSRTAKTGSGYARSADAFNKALQYFVEHPQQAALSVRELETLIGVSKSSIATARKRYHEMIAAAEVSSDDKT